MHVTHLAHAVRRLAVAVNAGRAARAAVLTIAVGSSACGGGDGGSEPPRVAAVVVSPQTVTVTAGATSQLGASVTSANGTSLSRPVTWSSGSAAIATVSASGLVTGVTVGATTITATADGVSGTAQVMVTPPPVASVTVAPTTLTLFVGTGGTLTATLRDAAGGTLSGRAVTWTSSNASVATVASTPTGATVTAVAPGTTTITATSEGISGTAAVTVALVPVASVAIAPSAPAVPLGATVALTATTRDSAGGALTGRTVAWTSSAPAVATVTPAGATTTVTALAVGTTQVTATSEGRSAVVTVTVTSPDLVLTRDTTVSGTVSVGRLVVPRGVTLTASAAAVVSATGSVEILGAVRASCTALELSAASLTVRGTVSNRCATPAAGGDLTLRSAGGLRLDSAVVESDGAIVIATGARASSAGRASLRRAGALRADTLSDPCVIQHSRIGSPGLAPAGAAGTPKGSDGTRGRDAVVQCGGHLQALGMQVFSKGGGPGGRGTSSTTQAAVGGNGGAGGNVIVEADGMITFEVSSLFAQAGGRGGDAVDGGAGTVKEATAGAAGASGLVLVNGLLGTDVKASGLGLFLNEAANSADAANVRHGGAASVNGDDGQDAGTAPATAGQSVRATGGTGGSVGDAGKITRVLGDLMMGVVTGGANIDVTIGKAGNGGAGVATAGDGGKGNAQFRDGAASGNATANGGRGGDTRVMDNTKGGSSYPGGPGDGGLIRFAFGMGGLGFGTCDLPWLPGGKGGDGGTSTGTSGTPGTNPGGQSGQQGETFYQRALNGGNGGPGAGPGAAGGKGTEAHVATGATQNDAQSFKPGQPGSGCVTPEVDTRVTPSGGDASHENFGRMGPRRKKRFRFKEDEDDLRQPTAVRTAVTGRQSLAVHQITIEGDGPWIPLTGTLDDQGNFSATGLGTYAGFTGIDATYTGKLTLDGAGKVIGVNGTLEIGKNGKLPGGQPIIYTMVAP